MSLKDKVPLELKIQAVEDYLAVRKGSTQIRAELGIRLSTFQSWLRKYQTEGLQGLYSKKGLTSYSAELKNAKGAGGKQYDRIKKAFSGRKNTGSSVLYRTQA